MVWYEKLLNRCSPLVCCYFLRSWRVEGTGGLGLGLVALQKYLHLLATSRAEQWMATDCAGRIVEALTRVEAARSNNGKKKGIIEERRRCVKK